MVESPEFTLSPVTRISGR